MRYFFIIVIYQTSRFVHRQGLTMRSKNERIREAFKFLIKRAEDGKAFTDRELAEAANWTIETTRTHLSKKLHELVQEKDNLLYVLPDIMRVNQKEFEDLFGQKRNLFSKYDRFIVPNVLVYEFFMLLSREDLLRKALDRLFYSDTIRQSVREIGIDKVRNALEFPVSQLDDQVIEYVRDFVEKTIGGYSLYLVNGRFRADSLALRDDVARRDPTSGPYIVDEMTAVVRFILPVEITEVTVVQNGLFEPPHTPSLNANKKAEQLRWLFLNLFAEPVIRLVKNEDQIWLLETGMRSALYKWIRKE